MKDHRGDQELTTLELDEESAEASEVPAPGRSAATDWLSPDGPGPLRCSTPQKLPLAAGAAAGPEWPFDLARLSPGKLPMTTLQASQARPPIRRKASPGASAAPRALEALDEAAASSGSPLPDALRRELEQALGVPLSGVRIHTDGAAARSTVAVGARAFVRGQDIFFGAGEYRPEERDGRQLIAHEVAHIVQPAGPGDEVSQPGDPIEREADAFADAFSDSGAEASARRRPSSRQTPGTAPPARGPTRRWYHNNHHQELIANRRRVQQALEQADEEGRAAILAELRAAERRTRTANRGPEWRFEMISLDGDDHVALATEDIRQLLERHGGDAEEEEEAPQHAGEEQPAEQGEGEEQPAEQGEDEGGGETESESEIPPNPYDDEDDGGEVESAAGLQWWTFQGDDPRLAQCQRWATHRLRGVNIEHLRVGTHRQHRPNHLPESRRGGTVGLTSTNTRNTEATNQWVDQHGLQSPAIRRLMSQPRYHRFEHLLPAVLDVLEHEGGVAAVNTYDNQLLTVGGGFGVANGSGDDVLARLPESMRSELWEVGYYPGADAADTRVLVLSGEPRILEGEVALDSFRLDRRRMAFLQELLASNEQYQADAPEAGGEGEGGEADDAEDGGGGAAGAESSSGRAHAFAAQVPAILDQHMDMPQYAIDNWDRGQQHLALQCKHAASSFFHWSDHTSGPQAHRAYDGASAEHIGTAICKQFLRRARLVGSGASMHGWLARQQGGKIHFVGDVEAAWHWALAQVPAAE